MEKLSIQSQVKAILSDEKENAYIVTASGRIDSETAPTFDAELTKAVGINSNLVIDLKGVASIEELRDMCVDLDVKMIGCQMTMDVFGFKKEEFIKECTVGGAAMFLEYAADADVQLFI